MDVTAKAIADFIFFFFFFAIPDCGKAEGKI